MTLLGKLLAFLNLIAGLAIVAWSVSIYTERPGWFDKIPEAVDKGSTPETFDQFKQEIETYGKAAAAASQAWGANLKRLEAAEARRATRQKEYAVRLGWARNGNAAKGGAAFFGPVYEKNAAGKDTAFLDLDPAKLGPAVPGPDAQPLRGADTLLANLAADTKDIVSYSDQIAAQRLVLDGLGKQILDFEGRLVKMTQIRESVQSELFYLLTYELNVYANRGTVFARQKQLKTRLEELGVKQ